jgi:hypothetical protein
MELVYLVKLVILLHVLLLVSWLLLSVRADCSIADEPGHLPHIGGLSPFGTVSNTISFSQLIRVIPIKVLTGIFLICYVKYFII